MLEVMLLRRTYGDSLRALGLGDGVRGVDGRFTSSFLHGHDARSSEDGCSDGETHLE